MNRAHSFATTAAALVLLLAWSASPASAERYSPKIGKPHPQIVLPNATGGEQPLTLSRHRGKKVLLIHFSTWSQACRDKLPLWNEITKQYVADGKLVVLGIAQEQYADRCRLFAQWKDIDWPIMHDVLNLTGLQTLPQVLALDEHGVVRHVNIEDKESLTLFVQTTFDAPKTRKPNTPPVDTLPDPRQTRRDAAEAREAARWLAHGNALVLAGKPQQIEEAIRTFGHATDSAKKDAASWFGLGVAHRIRYDSPQRQPGDFQAAIDAWHKAASLRTSNEVYRGRVQQYGPAVDKPCAFYAWIPTARQSLVIDDKTPIELAVEPAGTEMLDPKDASGDKAPPIPEGDPKGKVARDSGKLIQCETTLVRATVKAKHRHVQVYLTCRPDPDKEAHWNNEAEPLQVWITEPPSNVRVQPAYIDYVSPVAATSDETRTLCFEVRLPKKKKKGVVSLHGYALYNATATSNGKPAYLRQDFTIEIPVAP